MIFQGSHSREKVKLDLNPDHLTDIYLLKHLETPLPPPQSHSKSHTLPPLLPPVSPPQLAQEGSKGRSGES